MAPQRLTYLLVRYCSDYKGEPRNIRHKTYWEYERDIVEWIKLITKEMRVRIDFNFIEKFTIQNNLPLDIITIEHYISCTVPNIPRKIRLLQNEKHVRYGETFYDKFFATDKEWEAFRTGIAIPDGGIKLSRNP